MYKHLQKISALLLIGALVFTSCKDDPASLNNDEPPPLPPTESMEMDFSTFENNQAQKSEADQQNVNNFAQAAFRALIAKAVVNVNLAIPKVILEAASNAEAELNENEEWVWSYGRTAGNDTFEVRLVASRESADEVNWQFFVTNSSLNIDDKLFFSGSTNTEGIVGTWIYYNLLNSEEDEAVSQITWSVNGEDDVELRLEVVSDRNGRQGDFLEYTFDGTIKNVIYFDADKEETTELEWNTETNAGFIIAPDFNNGEKACWDENFADVACSGA